MRAVKYIVIVLAVSAVAIAGYRFFNKLAHENKILKEVIGRLEADSRIAEVLVTGVNYDEAAKKTRTTIKFLEYDSKGKPLPAQYFTFTGNIIQFQSLVIRFDDTLVRKGDWLKGKSAYIFWKVFMLDGKNTQEYEITTMNAIPAGYKVEGLNDAYESQLWQRFWEYALNPEKSKQVGIKNAQIEAPGTMFLPGHVYVLKIEHDGGIRIDTTPIPSILKGEKIPQ